MLSIELGDLIGVLKSCVPQLVAIGVIIVAAIAAAVLCRKMEKNKKFLVRTQTVAAAVLAITVVVNLMCVGPFNTLLTLASGEGVITEATNLEASKLAEEITDEGIILLQNEDNMLPMSGNSKLNVFGWASINPCYGGTGSGSQNDTYPHVTLFEGLTNAGFELNTELSDFYTAYRADRPVVSIGSQDYTLPEPPAKNYSQDLLNNAKSFSDQAVIFITRVGGEGSDIPINLSVQGLNESPYTENSTEYKDFDDGEHYLQLSRSERDMVELVCDNFDNVTLIYNGANPFELGFVEDFDEIKSVVWCAAAGQTGFNSLGRVLRGATNPSGKTVDAVVYDLTATPVWNNFGPFLYENMKDDEKFHGPTSRYYPDGPTPAFARYVEGIYVGYRYWETADAEGSIDYDSMVMYPFGYGLSYTSFTQEMGPISESNGTISFDVTVTNTGSVAGKDVVEVYYNPPYTNGGIEKAAANLVAFDKTELLEPGASEKISITFDVEDMASYDYQGAGCYVLEQGDYLISIRSDSHNIIDEQTYTVASTVTYGEGNARSTDLVAAVNRFDDVAGDVEYLSRADHFANYNTATAAPSAEDYIMSEQGLADFINTEIYDPTLYDDPNDVMPTTGKKSGLMLKDMRGLDYDDPKWDTMMDQLTVDEMNHLISLCGYQTPALESIGKLRTFDFDGPAAINNNFTGVGSIGFPGNTMLTMTWNIELAYRLGQSIGQMAEEMDVTGWYAPSMNTHRSAFGGRNFEYYSEDGYLAGAMAAQSTKGAREFGMITYIKHFALNDQETHRLSMLCNWCNEQAMREIYLKPFEMSVKEGGANGFMSAYTYLGLTWAGGSSALMKDVLRGEWGFVGFGITDSFGAEGRGYQGADQGVRNGTGGCLINYEGQNNTVTHTDSATTVLAMREAVKDMLYTVVNSRTYSAENLETHMPAWQVIMIVVDVIIVALVAVLEFAVIRKIRKNKKTA